MQLNDWSLKMSNNPFEPPRADIRIDESATDKRLGWKVFFLLMLILNIFGFYSVFVGEAFQLMDILDLLVYLFVLLALFGYAFKKAFFTQGFWKVLLPISLLVDISSLFTDVSDVFQNEMGVFVDAPIFYTDLDLGGIGVITIIIMFVILVPIMLLQYLILYRYGYTDREPWNNQHEADNKR